MRKPVIWHFNGKWWCGRYQGLLMKIPVADILGGGQTPQEAYAEWVKCKWGVARAIVKSRAKKSNPIINETPDPKLKNFKRFREWLKA